MATKRRYKRRTYRKKKRTQKRRVRRGGANFLDSVKSAIGIKRPEPSITEASKTDNEYYIKKAKKDCKEAKETKAYCENTENNSEQDYYTKCIKPSKSYQNIIHENNCS